MRILMFILFVSSCVHFSEGKSRNRSVDGWYSPPPKEEKTKPEETKKTDQEALKEIQDEVAGVKKKLQPPETQQTKTIKTLEAHPQKASITSVYGPFKFLKGKKRKKNE